jgi:PAS domain S-box-containing protein
MMITAPDAGPLKRYVIALLAAAVAFAASSVTIPLSPAMPWVFSFAAVMVTAWFCGQGPSLVTTAFLIVLGRFFFMSPRYTFTFNNNNSIQVLVFSCVSLFIGFLASARRRAEGHERAERRRFQATVMSIGDAVIATDAASRVVFMNGVAERLTGWNMALAEGKRLEEVFVIARPATAAPGPAVVNAALESPTAPALADDRVLVARDGSERPIDDSASPIKDDRGETTGMVIVFRDVSNRKEAERERKEVEAATRRRAEQLERLADIATRINLARDVNSVIGVVTEEARNLIGARQSATSMVLHPLHAQPRSVVSTGLDRTGPRTASNVGGAEFYEAAQGAKRPVRLTQRELAHDPRWQAFEKVALARPTLSGWLAVSLVGRNGKSIGLLQLADKVEGEFTAEDEAILVQLARLAAIAVENALLYDELRANDQRKDEFLAMLAHELRNPLAAIGNAVNLTRRTALKEHLDWSIDVITRQMNHLTRLIDDLLDVSRINRGKIELRKDLLEAKPILESAAASIRPLIDERKHSLEVTIDSAPLWVSADPTRLEQVVVNLLNNAAKYSENGGHIHLWARNEGGEVVITVRDRGVGIAPEKLSGMFELFAQGDRSLARSEGGLGIGLTVVKKLVELHGGSIVANSEGVDKGSEFTIRLPAATNPAEPTANTPAAAAKGNKKARILVVDDNVDTALGMERLLKLIGHETAIAHDGNAALDLARKFRPEFILLDIGLPGMDGYEVAARMRQEAWCEGAVIVAVSGYGQDEDRRRSTEAGFDHHFIKPLDHDALLSLLSIAGPGAH